MVALSPPRPVLKCMAGGFVTSGQNKHYGGEELRA